MGSSTAAGVLLRKYRFTQTAIARFTFRRTLRSAVFVALTLGIYVSSKATGFATAYPSLAERQAVSASYASNTGIIALVGRPYDLTQVSSFVAWNTLIIMSLIGSIWGFLLATKMLRGEEEMGRWELLLSGGTTARRALCNVLAGMAGSLLVVFCIAGGVFAAVGQLHTVDFPITSALFFALTVVSAIAAYMAVGVLASQIMPTRGKASALAAAVFGISFLIRALADISNIHWLLSLSPLGWIEQMQPMLHNNAVWLIPIVAWVATLIGLSIFLAGRRDLGDSIVADRDTAKSHTMLLNRPIAAAWRMTRSSTISWAVSIIVGSIFFGVLTKTAAQAFSESASAQRLIGELAHASKTTGAKEFLGIMFLLLMVLIMSFVASSVNAIRQDEARGYLDNLLVRPVSRLGWLAGRIALIAAAALTTAIGASLVAGATLVPQKLGISWSDMLLSGVNMFAPVLFVLGAGVLTFGILPRLTSVISFSIIAWSFLLLMVNSGLNLNHWILDTALFQHVALAPAASVNWGSWSILIGLSAAMIAIGTLVFTRRDITAE